MATRRITVEVDDDTAAGLGALGEPGAVLAHLAVSAATAVARQGHAHRSQTDLSLQRERDETDTRLEKNRAAEDETADEVVRVARERADEVIAVARTDAGPGVGDAGAPRARVVLEQERAAADQVVEHERGLRRHGTGALAVERETTDRDLSGERVVTDSAVDELREANEQLVSVTLRAQEGADAAEEAQARAEERARELHVVAEFREMFIGILGHDLRNPLGAISIAAGMLLRRGRLDEQDKRVVARVITSTERMSRMITQLLDLTRARLGGGLPIERRPTDLRELCQQTVEELGAQTELEADGDLSGSWDADRLAEALSNLTGNALEYAAPGTRVRLVARADGDQVVVEVKNQGDPIAPEVLPFIFEPFRQGKQTERSPAGNLGLGLYIARQVMLAHGGTLEAHCSGGTTTFVMRLPRG